MAVERKPLKKAPARDVVEAFTAPPPQPETAPPAVTPAAENQADAAPFRRSVGRPRSKRRMEPFSSKIEIDLRDQLDDHLAANGGTMVDLLDAALRNYLKR
jgi:hypothetical protein